MRFLFIGAMMVVHALQLTIDVAPPSGDTFPVFLRKDEQVGVFLVGNESPIIPVRPHGIYEIVSVLHPEAGAAIDSNSHLSVIICERYKSEDCDRTPCWSEVARLVCCDPPDLAVPMKDRSRHLEHRTTWRPKSTQLLIVFWPITLDKSPRPTATHCPALLTRRGGLEGDTWEVCSDGSGGIRTITITKLSDQ